MTTSPAYDAMVQKLLDEGSTKSQARRIAVQRIERDEKPVPKRKGGWPKGKKRKAGK